MEDFESPTADHPADGGAVSRGLGRDQDLCLREAFIQRTRLYTYQISGSYSNALGGRVACKRLQKQIFALDPPDMTSLRSPLPIFMPPTPVLRTGRSIAVEAREIRRTRL